MEKKKYNVDIAGNQLTLISDEPEDFVRLITDTISGRMNALTRNSFRISALDAALLLSVDYLGEKLKTERRLRGLQSQLSLYEMTVSQLKAENEKLKAALAEAKAPGGVSAPCDENGSEPLSPADTVSNTLKNAGGDKESKLKALDEYLDERKNDSSSVASREEKIRYIESILKGN